jgi:hypothetical protein
VRRLACVPGRIEPPTVCLEEGLLLTRSPWSERIFVFSFDDHPTYIAQPASVTLLDDGQYGCSGIAHVSRYHGPGCSKSSHARGS